MTYVEFVACLATYVANAKHAYLLRSPFREKSSAGPGPKNVEPGHGHMHVKPEPSKLTREHYTCMYGMCV